MGEVADRSGIQFRLLIEVSPAVRGPRTQSDNHYIVNLCKKSLFYCNLTIFSDPTN